MTMIGSMRVAACALALPLLAGLASPALAQEANLRSVSRYRIKPDRDGDFRANVKEYIAVMKKANPDRAFTLWVSLSGPREYALVSYYGKYAELDITEDPKLKDVMTQLTAIGARINACVDNGERYIDQIQPDLSLPRTAEMPKIVRVMRSKVRPDRVNDYMNLIKTEWMPHARKSGVKTYAVSRMRLGRPSHEFSSIAALENWADLDGQSPIVKTMGDAAYQQYLSKIQPLILENQVDLYRFLPELSYIPAK